MLIKERPALLALVAGSSLILPAWLGLLLPGIRPLPFLTVGTVFLLDAWGIHANGYIALVVPTVLFFLWNPGLFLGRAEVPKRSLVLLGVSTFLTAVWFLKGWRYGLEYQGWLYTYAVCAINAAWLALLWVMLVRRLERSSFGGNLLLHWALFAWLAWCAFPYLGELP